MKKMVMQRNNREALRQNSNCHTFVDDAFFYNKTHSSLRRRPQTITQQRKQTFSLSLGCSRNRFRYFVKNLCGKFLICISQTELYVILHINSMEWKIIWLWILFVFGSSPHVLFLADRLLFWSGMGPGKAVLHG